VYEPLLSLTHATCSTHLFLLDLITQWYLVSSTEHKVPHYVAEGRANWTT
jgi:hypothetical protein